MKRATRCRGISPAIVAGQVPSSEVCAAGARWRSPGSARWRRGNTIYVNPSLARSACGCTDRTNLVDPDLHRGAASFMLNMASGTQSWHGAGVAELHIDLLARALQRSVGRRSPACCPARRSWPICRRTRQVPRDICSRHCGVATARSWLTCRSLRCRCIATCSTWCVSGLVSLLTDPLVAVRGHAACLRYHMALASGSARWWCSIVSDCRDEFETEQIEGALKIKVDVAIQDLPASGRPGGDDGRAGGGVQPPGSWYDRRTRQADRLPR